MSTQSKRPIWICGIGQTAAGDLTPTAGSEEAGAGRQRGVLMLHWEWLCPPPLERGRLLTIGGMYDTETSKWGCAPVANEQ
ncbi:MAG: hypothetical protein ACYS19_04970 [Planctomycetota bacterium]|jgi:hypothetical protein